MFAQQDWVLRVRDREVIARVEVGESGGWVVTRFSVDPGPSLNDLRLPVANEIEAAALIERALVTLMGTNW